MIDHLIKTNDDSNLIQEMEESNQHIEADHNEKEYQQALQEHYKELDQRDLLVDSDDDSIATKIKNAISEWR
jgi:FixJ family two-component response regulator